MNKLTYERLRALLAYNPDTGVFTRLSDGSVAGTVSGTAKKPARIIWVDGEGYYGARLAWLYMTGKFPPHQIDHKNCNRLDNSWDNLRPATNSQNTMNRRPWRDCGVKGVYFRGDDKNDRSVRQWRAIITANGHRRNLGHYATFEEANAAYTMAAIAFHGEFARVS